MFHMKLFPYYRDLEAVLGEQRIEQVNFQLCLVFHEPARGLDIDDHALPARHILEICNVSADFDPLNHKVKSGLELQAAYLAVNLRLYQLGGML